METSGNYSKWKVRFLTNTRPLSIINVSFMWFLSVLIHESQTSKSKTWSQTHKENHHQRVWRRNRNKETTLERWHEGQTFSSTNRAGGSKTSRGCCVQQWLNRTQETFYKIFTEQEKSRNDWDPHKTHAQARQKTGFCFFTFFPPLSGSNLFNIGILLLFFTLEKEENCNNYTKTKF